MAMHKTNTVTLQKGIDVFILRYEHGAENAALQVIVGWVKRPDLRFDWFDAAVMAHQMGQRMASELKSFLKGGVV